MRGDVAEADRRQEVREAARSWERAGAIDEATRKKIDERYADDRNRLGPIFRVLVFCFSCVVLQSMLGLTALFVASAGEAVAPFFYFLCGLGFAALTEVQMGSLKRRQGGTEAATAFLAVSLLVGTSFWIFYSTTKPGEDVAINTLLVLAIVILGATGYRWGFTLFVALAAIAGFVLLGRAPVGRLLWVVAALVIAPLALQGSSSPKLPPAHRCSCQAVTAVALVFLYLAVHLSSWDFGLVEMITGHWQERFGAPRPFRGFFILATALVPVGTLVWGIASRRRLLLNLGAVGLLASLITLRFYVHVAPLFVVLIGGGAVAIGLALLLRRYLDSGDGRERGGFTAEPVFTDPEGRSALEVAASVASFTPAARPGEQPGFQGGGGRSGGAGASGNF